MTITSQYPGTCRRCGGHINVGERIEWERGNGSQHLECPTTPDGSVVEADDNASYPVRPLVDLTPGVYEVDGTVYVVKPNREKTRLYAKQLVESPMRALEAGGRVPFDFQYAPGAIYQIRESHRMPLERAKELAVRYGRCINCGKHLKAAESVEKGIGPVCAKRFAA